MLVYTGSYLGSGIDGKKVETPFVPKVIIVRERVNSVATGMRLDTQVGDASFTPGANSATIADIIQTIETSYPYGFTVGTSTSSNTNAANYDFTVFGDNGLNDIETGTYAGTGVDTDITTAINSAWDFVFVKRSDAASQGYFRTSSHSGDLCSFLTATASGSDRIQSQGTGTFQVGGNATVNAVGGTYHYLCMKNVPNVFKVGVYTGDGADNRNITGLNFNPTFLAIKSSSGTNGGTVSMMKGITTDTSPLWTASGTVADRVQSLTIPQNDGFQIGTTGQVNTNTNLYYWFAARTFTGKETTKLNNYQFPSSVGGGNGMSYGERIR